MNREQTNLRDRLFEKYFELEEGIVLSDFMNSISIVIETWKNLHQLLEENVESFDSHSHLEMIKNIRYKGNCYLIIKSCLWDYIIIDLTTKQALNKDKVKANFNEKFFIDNFGEYKTSCDDYIDMYHFSEYGGKAQDLIRFYDENQQILNIPTPIYYKNTIGNAWTYISINLTTGNTQLGFQTPDQFLYEHLFLNSDLTPWGDTRCNI